MYYEKLSEMPNILIFLYILLFYNMYKIICLGKTEVCIWTMRLGERFQMTVDSKKFTKLSNNPLSNELIQSRKSDLT